MIGNGIWLPIGKYKRWCTKMPTKNLMHKLAEQSRMCEGQKRLCFAQGHPMSLADGDNWSPRALALSLLPHNALELWDRLGRRFSSPNMGPWDWRAKQPLENQAQPIISCTGTVTYHSKNNKKWCLMILCSFNNHLQSTMHFHINGLISFKSNSQALGFNGTGF